MNLCADQFASRRADESRKAVVHSDDGLAVANQQAFYSGVGQSPHTLSLELYSATISEFLGTARECKHDDDEACASYRNCKPACGQRRSRNFNSRVRNDCSCGHCCEMVAA